MGRFALHLVTSVWAFVSTVALGGAITMLIAWKVFGLMPMAVTSGSMEPTLPVKSLIFVQSVPPTKVEVGDIITFDAPGEEIGRVTHRVTRISTHNGKRYFETKGDANKQADDWRKYLPAPPPAATGHAKQQWVPGVSYGSQQAVRYVWGVPYLGHAIQLAQRPQLRMAVLISVLALFGLVFLSKIWFGTPRRIAPAPSTAIGEHAEVAFVPDLHLAVNAGSLCLRVRTDEPDTVVEVHRVPLPDSPGSVRDLVSRVTENVTTELAQRLPDLRGRGGVDAVIDPGSAARAALQRGRIGTSGDESLSRETIERQVAMFAERAQLVEPAGNATRSTLLELVTMQTVLEYFDVTAATLTEEPEAMVVQSRWARSAAA